MNDSIIKKSGTNYTYFHNEEAIEFNELELNENAELRLKEIIALTEEKTSSKVKFVSPIKERFNTGKIHLLIDKEYILIVITSDFDSLLVCHQLLHMILYADGFDYLHVNIGTEGNYFLNNIVSDIIINEKLYPYFETELKKSKRAINSFNLEMINSYSKEQLFKTYNQNDVILKLILVYVHNMCFKFEKINLLLNKAIQKDYPFVQIYGDKIISIINSYDISTPEQYKLVLRDILDLELFEPNLTLQWLK